MMLSVRLTASTINFTVKQMTAATPSIMASMKVCYVCDRLSPLKYSSKTLYENTCLFY
jgi:hypothetical protein